MENWKQTFHSKNHQNLMNWSVLFSMHYKFTSLVNAMIDIQSANIKWLLWTFKTKLIPFWMFSWIFEMRMWVDKTCPHHSNRRVAIPNMHCNRLQATLWDMTSDWKTSTFQFFHHILSTQVYSYWLLFIKLKYSEYSFSYAIQQYEVCWDAGKGKVIANSVITASPIAS